jgi:hypothetical protein
MSHSSSKSVATEKDEAILWHIKRVVAAKAQDGVWMYQVVYEDSMIEWQYFNSQETDGHKLEEFASSCCKQGGCCIVCWMHHWQSAGSVPEKFIQEFWDECDAETTTSCI